MTEHQDITQCISHVSRVSCKKSLIIILWKYLTIFWRRMKVRPRH